MAQCPTPTSSRSTIRKLQSKGNDSLCRMQQNHNRRGSVHPAREGRRTEEGGSPKGIPVSQNLDYSPRRRSKLCRFDMAELSAEAAVMRAAHRPDVVSGLAVGEGAGLTSTLSSVPGTSSCSPPGVGLGSTPFGEELSPV